MKNVLYAIFVFISAFRTFFLHATSHEGTCQGHFINESCFPFVISPENNNANLESINEWIAKNRESFNFLLEHYGAILLRDFPLHGPEDFASIVKTITGRALLNYKGESSYKAVVPGVYTFAEALANFKIPLHNELMGAAHPVDYIGFYCEVAPQPEDGQPLIGKTKDITKVMMERKHIWNLFDGRLIKYISRHPPPNSYYPKINPEHETWEQVFGTVDVDEIAKICECKGYAFKWVGGWLELTRYVPAIFSPDAHFDHPYWFNQAHLYHDHPKAHGGGIKHSLAGLLYMIPSTKQYEVKFEDDSKIPSKIIYEIHEILDEKTVTFSWHQGDVLLLDNYKVLHGKAPCTSESRVLVTMVE